MSADTLGTHALSPSDTAKISSEQLVDAAPVLLAPPADASGSAATDSAENADRVPTHPPRTIDDAPTIVLHVKCLAGSLPTLESVPVNTRVAELKRRIHAARADLPAHLQRLAVMARPAGSPSATGDNGDDGVGANAVFLDDDAATLDAFACVTDGCTVDVVMAEGRVTFSAAAYLAAVLEYLCADMVELAGNAAEKRKRANICVRDIRAVIKNDDEFEKMIDALAMYHQRALPFMFPARDAEYSDNLVESMESVDGYKYAHWGRDQDEREDDDDDESDDDDELSRTDARYAESAGGSGSTTSLSADDAAAFLSAHIKPLILRRGVATSLDLAYHDRIYSVLKQVKPDMGITEQAMATMNSIVNLALNAIATFAFYCAAEGCETTLTVAAIQARITVESVIAI